MYKRGETVWVLHDPYTATNQKQFIKVKVFSGEEYIGHGLNSRRVICYKHHGEKKSIDVRFVNYSKNTLIENLLKANKEEFNEKFERETKKIKESEKLVAMYFAHHDSLKEWFESQKEEE